MEKQVNLNGTLMTGAAAAGQTGRGFRYGDGLFETIRLEGGRMPLLHYHVARLRRGMAFLGMTDASRYTEAWVGEQTVALAGEGASGRVRLVISRAGGGTYGPISDKTKFVLEFTQQAINKAWWTDVPIVGISEALRMPTHALANLKSTSALAYVQAARERQRRGWSEILLRNHHNRLSEGGYTNLFCRIDDHWYTPPLSEGGVAGVLRAFLLAQHPECAERIIDERTLAGAEEVILTNAVQGVLTVREVEGGRGYGQTAGRQLGSWLAGHLNASTP